MRRPLIAALVLATLAGPTLVGCGLFGDDGPYITVYNAQHEQLIEALADDFTKDTGIEVRLSSGEDFEKANQLVQEGDASPADVFLTENSPAMTVVDDAGLLAPLGQTTLAQIPSQFRPADGDWLGFAARSTAVVYNKAKLKPDQLPASILDFARPEWKGKIAFSPTGADDLSLIHI